MCAKRNALGKGLTALLSDSKTDITGKNPAPVNAISVIPLNQIEANPFQPRENIEEVHLEELVHSIRVHGIIQPITVRKVGYDKYQIISGERRTRAAIRAGLKEIPAFVRVANDQNMLEMALIENTHRQNLNVVEIAVSYKRLVEECNLTQEQLADRVGKNRTTVTNYLRMLKLPEDIQIALCEDRISMGHARALISVEDKDFQLEIFNNIIKENLSVRKVEELVKGEKEPAGGKSKSKSKKEKSPQIKAWEQKLGEKLDRTVAIKPRRGGKGELIIPFLSEEDLENLIRRIEEE